MKKLYLASLLLGVTAVANAQFTGEATDTQATPVAVASPYVTSEIVTVRQMPDNSYVTIEGNIVEQLATDNEKYRFSDASGQIVVEIDDKLWKGQQIGPENKVKILGELDQSRNPDKVKVEAVYIEVLQ